MKLLRCGIGDFCSCEFVYFGGLYTCGVMGVEELWICIFVEL